MRRSPLVPVVILMDLLLVGIVLSGVLPSPAKWIVAGVLLADIPLVVILLQRFGRG
jgi:hypothetical protein